MARIKISGDGIHGQVEVDGMRVPAVTAADLRMRVDEFHTVTLEIGAFPIEVEANGIVRISGTGQPEAVERALLDYLTDKYGPQYVMHHPIGQAVATHIPVSFPQPPGEKGR